MSQFLNALPRSNPQLFAMICRFNFALAADVPNHRFELEGDQPWLENVLAERRGLLKLSSAVSARHKISSAAFFDFEPIERRFALLDAATLARLGRFTTAAVHRQHIARTVLRAERLELGQTLGEDAMLFAVKRAEFLSVAHADALDGESGSVAGDLHAYMHCFEVCLANEPAGLLDRLQLKLPINVQPDFEQTYPDNCRKQMTQLMKRILLTEIAPELTPCFN